MVMEGVKKDAKLFSVYFSIIFFCKFLRYFFALRIFPQKLRKNMQKFLHSANIFAKKVHKFSEFFVTVNNIIKICGIFCTEYIFVKYLSKN